MAAPLITLNNGQKMPSFGLGTLSNLSADTVKYAISVGYRHIDTAWIYKNEKQVGEGIKAAIAENLVKREDLFITTKLWNIFHERDQVVPSCKESLAALGLDYLDLYLIHFPITQKKTDKYDGTNLLTDGAEDYDYDLAKTWNGMEECVKLGLTKSIGVSNFAEDDLNHILKSAKIIPVTNQVRTNPMQNQKDLIAFCKEKGISVTAHTPLNGPGKAFQPKGNPILSFDDPRLVNIGKKYGKNGAQVVLRYLLDIGTIPIPKSSNPDRIKQNINVFDFKLSPEDIKVMDSFNHFKSGNSTSYFKQRNL